MSALAFTQIEHKLSAAQARIGELEDEVRLLRRRVVHAEPSWGFLHTYNASRRILTLLVAASPKLVTRQDITDALYRGALRHDTTISAHMTYLRRALEPLGIAIARGGDGGWKIAEGAARTLLLLQAEYDGEGRRP